MREKRHTRDLSWLWKGDRCQLAPLMSQLGIMGKTGPNEAGHRQPGPNVTLTGLVRDSGMPLGACFTPKVRQIFS